MAGCFEHINNRKDFVQEVDLALQLCSKYIKSKGASNALINVEKQLLFIQDRMKQSKKFTKKERKSIDMGYRMHREYEEIHDDNDFYDFKELILLLNLYMDYWPTNKLASDPDNEDKIDWDAD
jgi:hypothetical protein